MEKKTDINNKLQGLENLTKDTFLVILDVMLLHTNISDHEGIEAV